MEIRKTIAFVFIFILFMCSLLSCGSTTVYIANGLNYMDLRETYHDLYKQVGLESEELFIIDYKSDGFTIWVNSTDGTVIEIMHDSIIIDQQTVANYEIITLNYSSERPYFRKMEGQYNISGDWQIYDRINMKNYLDFLSLLDVKTIMSEFTDNGTDYFEIRTDGLYKHINYNDYISNYSCYLYENETFTKLNEEMFRSISNVDKYVPVFLSIGEIICREEVDIYKNEICAVIVIKRG